MHLQATVHHTSFAVKDLERSRFFYEEILGLTPKPRPDLGIPGIWYQAGACEVHLIQTFPGVDLGTPPPEINPMARHEAFAIADYDQALAILQSHGLEVLETSAVQGQMWVRDPDGNIIELIATPKK
jgi:glyoxylase I family protein